MIRQSGTRLGGGIGGQVRGELQGTGTAIVHPAATWISQPTKRSKSPLAIYSSVGLLECWMRVGGDGFYTTVGKYSKYDREAQSGWGQQKLRRMECREGRSSFCTYRWVHHGFIYGLGKTASGTGELPNRDMAQPSYKLGGCLHCIFKILTNKRFVQGEAETGD